MAIRVLAVAVVALSLITATGDLSAQAGLNLGPTTTKRITFHQNGVLLGTLEIPAGVVFGLTDEAVPQLSKPQSTARQLELRGQNEVLIGSQGLVSGVSIRTGRSVVLAIESR